MVDSNKPIATITGISGFIGSQVCLDFLRSGEFRVRGTVRDKDNESKIAPLRKAFGDFFGQLELVNADLLNADSLGKAIAGSTYVVHTASPFFFPENEDDVIKPAVEGTLAVLRACSASGGVKRCVITSSCAAIVAMANKDKPDLETGFYDETCWSDPNRPEGLSAYLKSKTLAERAAWDYQKSLPEDQKFEIVTINPCFVQGPSLIPGGFTSANFIVGLFNGSKAEVTTNGMGIVDVRDVSKMHLEAVRRPEAANHRFISYSERVFPKQAVDWLNDEFGPKGFTVTTKEAATPRDKDARVSNKKAREILGIDFIPAKDAIVAMAQSLVDLGVIVAPSNKWKMQKNIWKRFMMQKIIKKSF